MKAITRRGILIAAFSLGVMLVSAQTFTNLQGFNAGSDGSAEGLLLSGNTLYGTTYNGGSSGVGTVFAINTSGTGYTNLHSFTGYISSSGINTDGANPEASLILSGSTLYGTTFSGGSNGVGSVFAINTDGTSFKTLHSFSVGAGVSSGGYGLAAGLVLSSNTLYGTTESGGANNAGDVFKLNNDGSSFTNLHSFSAVSDGISGVVLSGNTLYGTISSGGGFGYGAIYAVNTDGTGYTNLYSFGGNDVYSPSGGLILSGNILYGTTTSGGSGGKGTVFAININGTGFVNLHSFISSDGIGPQSGVILSSNALFGTTLEGGSSGYGTVFAIATNGTGFTVLYNFTGGSDGGWPTTGLILSSNILYGITQHSVIDYGATIFSLLTPPPSITTPPQSLIVTNGYPASFTVSASGTPPLFYQWQKNSNNLTDSGNVSGSASNTLNLASTSTNDAGTYKVIITNSFGSITSTGGILTVLSIPPGIQIQPVSTNVFTGSNPQFSVSATGSIPLNYQWYFNGLSIAGATNATLQLQNVITNQTGNYQVVVANSFGTTISTPAYLGVYIYPAITSQTPANNYLYTARGATETLSVTAVGTAIQYQWYNNTGSINGATNSSLTLSNITSALNGNTYWVVVSNVWGAVSSGTIQLYVNLASRQLSTGRWQGIGYWPYFAMTNTIKVAPPVGTFYYAVQEGLAVYPTDSSNDVYRFIVGPINNGGTVDATNFLIKWGPFFDDQPRTLTYVIIPPFGITNWAQFAGIISADGTNYNVAGDSLMNLLPYHPADTVDGNVIITSANNLPTDTSSAIDGKITANELTAYALAWKSGGYWAVEPNPIPINYLTSAGFIWRSGEFYTYNPAAGAPPACWVSSNPSTGQSSIFSQITPGVSNSTAVCIMTNICTPNVPFVVTLIVTPANTVNGYVVEDQFPARWTVSNISASGVVDAYNNEVKWGPFLNNSAQIFTYQITPPQNIPETNTFAGIVSLDGNGIAITGVRQVNANVAPRPGIASISLSGTNLVFNGSNGQSGRNYITLMSTNVALPLNQWTPVATNPLNVNGNFTITATNAVNPSDSKRFYLLQAQ